MAGVYKETYAFAIPRWFTHEGCTQPYGLIICLPCVRIPSVVSRPIAGWDRTDTTALMRLTERWCTGSNVCGRQAEREKDKQVIRNLERAN
jgi:hypothetical protein